MGRKNGVKEAKRESNELARKSVFYLHVTRNNMKLP